MTCQPLHAQLWRPYIANCILWAWVMQLRLGGYMCWRQSRYGWWPHAAWSLDGRCWWEYLPRNFAGRLKWWQVLWLVLFRGEPRRVEREWL